MSHFDGLIEITQDGAGVIEAGSSKAKGFFTADVMTCIVCVYVCERATIMIHDSGQLKISDIVTFIDSYGAVKKLVVVSGENASPEAHEDRVNTIMSKFGLTGEHLEAKFVPLPAFAVLSDLNGDVVATGKSIPSGVSRIPDSHKRWCVCNVNNFFSAPKSESLTLDIQYQQGKYAPAAELNQSLEELLGIVDEQPDYFFLNITFLHEAHKSGLLSLPTSLIDLAKKYNLERLIKNPLSDEDKAMQLKEYESYMREATV
ncbi:hypothetical protein L539_3477 [Bordetella hinzii 5132]|uniref:hypothetical protein n=1 Tax=Bordetella hinzii TaxID=103855 RepID=UPI00045B1B89|nr:hypothetical protein [Bordetella hinzii]KCB41349.1 hypothetical protein L539_3477 [Bordetella hinzii 5132]